MRAHLEPTPKSAPPPVSLRRGLSSRARPGRRREQRVARHADICYRHLLQYREIGPGMPRWVTRPGMRPQATFTILRGFCNALHFYRFTPKSPNFYRTPTL